MCIKALPNRFVKRATFRFRSISGTKSHTAGCGVPPRPTQQHTASGHLLVKAQQRKDHSIRSVFTKVMLSSLGFNTCENAGLPQTAVGNPSARYKSGVLATSYLLELFCDAQYAIYKLNLSQIHSGYRMQHCRRHANIPLFCSAETSTTISWGYPSARYKSGVLATSGVLELFCEAQYAI